MVEQPAVNRLVVGSNPTSGANFLSFFRLYSRESPSDHQLPGAVFASEFSSNFVRSIVATRKTCEIIVRDVITEIIQQQERVEIRSVAGTEFTT
jgi:hypothetical protein